MELIDKAAVVSEIERRKKIVEKRLYINTSYSEEGNAAWERDKALYDTYNSLLSSLDTFEVTDPYERCVQYQSVMDGVKAHAKTYSFNIDSELFPQLTKEQQKLWRKEIEYACISGGDMGYILAKDPRYRENHEVKEVDLKDSVKETLAQKYIDYTFKRHNIDPESREGQLIYYAYMHGMNQCLDKLKAQKGE